MKTVKIEHRSDLELTKGTPYLAHMGELTMTMDDNENRLLPVTTKVHIHNKSMVKHFTATAKGAEALAYGPQQEYIDKYKIQKCI